MRTKRAMTSVLQMRRFRNQSQEQVPAMPATTDAQSTPSLASSTSAPSSNASPEISSDTVKPMPPSTPMPAICGQVDAGR